MLLLGARLASVFLPDLFAVLVAVCVPTLFKKWLAEIGIDYPLIEGGYKALRQATIEMTNELVQRPIILIGGCTGNGKNNLSTLLYQRN